MNETIDRRAVILIQEFGWIGDCIMSVGEAFGNVLVGCKYLWYYCQYNFVDELKHNLCD